jgi:hypothetical protein
MHSFCLEIALLNLNCLSSTFKNNKISEMKENEENRKINSDYTKKNVEKLFYTKPIVLKYNCRRKNKLNIH